MTTLLIVAAATGVGAQSQLRSGIDLKDLNQTVSPGADFYEYACGGWMKNNPLPAAYSRYGSFDRLGEDNNKRINGILTELLSNTYTKGSVEQKLSDYYKLAMDSVRRNKEGVSPAMPIMREFEAAKTVDELRDLQMKYTPIGMQEFLYMGFGADEKNSTQNILNVYQGGVQLGQKEYYLDDDPATKSIREAYKKHIVRMFKLFGFKAGVAKKRMQDIMNVETAMARVMKSRTELRDVEANYNKMSLADFRSRYPNVPLERTMQAMGVKAADYQQMVVGQPAYIEGVDKILSTITADEYRAILEWDLIVSSANYLSDDIVAANFDFFGKTISGRKENHPRWKRATSQVESKLGEALGKMYCERFFPASSKERMERLVRNLQLALAERIMAQNWMETDTKLAALAKLSTFYVKIGYPDKWKDYSGMNIDPQKSFLDNYWECNRWQVADEIARKAGKPVDNTEWFMTPQTVNAYYNPTTNEICFPAGILQVPFFDPTADDVFNYGAIGVVIGHEMTHGFDDQGRHYDKVGNMTDWWTENDAKGFDERAKLYSAFFSKIKVLPDLNANGDLTLGENLADHGGLQVAWYAYKNATKGTQLPTIDDLTADQRFFIAYAGVWAGNITEKEIRSRTKSDPHSLGRWRVNGALPHVDMWYDAFGVKEGDQMFIPKADRLDLW